MSEEKEDRTRATRRLNTDEVNKKAKTKKTKTSSETQVVGKVNVNSASQASKNNSKKNKGKKKKFKEKHPRIATILKIFLILIILLIIICAGIFAGALWGGYNFFDLLGDDYKIDISDLAIKYENSIVYDLAGNQIATLSSGSKRKCVNLEQMSEYLPKAYISIEDERFYDHSGVDFKRTAAATVTYIFNGGNSSFGGSTITQQVVKNITNDKEDTAMRKVKEMAKALQVEHYLSKDEILELYLNLIFVGGKDVNGVALGAIYYFNKDVKDLSLAECAYMAAINNTPNSYNPFKEDDKKKSRIEAGEKRAKTVLTKMKELKYITDEEYNSAVEEVDKGLAFVNGDTDATALVSYHTEAALEQIINQMVEEKGLSKELAEIKLYSGGYHIYTTQDTSVQGRVEQELSQTKYLKKSASGQESMATMVIIDPKTGNVVGSSAGIGEEKTHTYLGYFNYPTSLKKQTGSSMKPIAVIAPGLESGAITAGTVFYDGYTMFPGNWDPKEWFGAYKETNMTMRTAIEISANIPNAKALSRIGLNYSVEFCNKLGLTDIKGDEGLSLALGGLTTGLSAYQMASAYAMISNDGVYVEPTFYTKVLDGDKNTFIEPKSVEERSTRVMDASNAYIAKSILTSPVVGGQGTASYCKINGMDVAAKTGTTNSSNDRWLCGFTNYYAAACWYGYEKQDTVNFSGNPAGQIWSAVMKDIHGGLEPSTFTAPSNIVTASVCIDSGMRASSGCHNVYTEQFVEGTVPAECDRHNTVKICNQTGLLASEFCENYSERYLLKLPDTELEGNWKTTYNSDRFNAPTAICPHTAADYKYED